jgi:hypothetical protein
MLFRFTAEESRDLIQRYLSVNPDPNNENVSEITSNPKIIYTTSNFSLIIRLSTIPIVVAGQRTVV